MTTWMEAVRGLTDEETDYSPAGHGDLYRLRLRAL
jgi:hypothetical protein